MALIYFLLVYDAQRGRMLGYEEYVHADQAMRDFARLETDHRDSDGVQVLLLTADSRETLEATHGHYFQDVDPDKALLAIAGE